MLPIAVTAFYKFKPITQEALPQLKSTLNELATRFQVKGLVLLSTEGINATVSMPHEELIAFKEALQKETPFSALSFKDSSCQEHPFHRFVVDYRKELITTKDNLPFPPERNNHLSPKEWHETLQTQRDEILLVDTRNWYETKLGVFKGAVDPKISVFSELRDYLENRLEGKMLPRDKKVLMYCTGGIRCEKASLEFSQAGFKNVYQLDGGILNYLKEYPEGEYEGECYVFDHRIAVDTHLRPSVRYHQCPHCGNPTDHKISCRNCKKQEFVCESCSATPERQSCSKNCTYHLKRQAIG